MSWGVSDVKKTGKATSWREEQHAPPRTLGTSNCARTLSHLCLECTGRCHDLWTTTRSRASVSRPQIPSLTGVSLQMPSSNGPCPLCQHYSTSRRKRVSLFHKCKMNKHPRRQNDAKRHDIDRSTTTAAPRAPPPPKRRDTPGKRQEHHGFGTTRTPANATLHRHAHPGRKKDATHQGTDRSTTTAPPRAPPPRNGRDAPRHSQENQHSAATRTGARRSTLPQPALPGLWRV